MRSIYALATDSAGCFYQRLQMPLDELCRQRPDDYAWKVGGLPNHEYPRGSVIIAQRFHGDNPAWRDLCERADLLCVYDLDDDLIDVDPANGVPYSIYQPARDGTIANIVAAHVVTVSTHNLATKVRRWNPNVVVLPNCIADDLERKPVPRDPGLTIGWAGSMFHQQDFLAPFLEEISRVARTYPWVNWVSIGADYLRPALPPSAHYQTFVWGPMNWYHQCLSMLDIGLAPLAETEFNQHKSWIKALDYMACGVIPVLQNWGQYPELITPLHRDTASAQLGGVGFTTSESWMGPLSYLIDLGPEGIAEQQARAREVSQQWTISRQVYRWRDVYEKGPR